MSVIYNALKKFKNHPQKKKTKKGDAKKRRHTVSFKKLLFSSSALTGCILLSFFIGIIVLFSVQDQKQGVPAKTDATGIIARKVQDRKAQTVHNRPMDRRKAFKTSQQNPAGNIPAPSGSLDDSITQTPSSGPLEEEDLNRARYLAPRPRNGPFQHEHLQNDEWLSYSSRHLGASSSAAAAEEFRSSGSDKAEPESGSSRAQSHPAAREKMLPVRVRARAEIIRLVAKIKKSIRHGTAVNTENLLDQLAVLIGTDDRYVLKLRAYWSLQNNDNESAASYLTKVLEKNSEDLEAGINMAIIDINSHRPQMARIRLQELEKIYPDNLLIADLMQKLR